MILSQALKATQTRFFYVNIEKYVLLCFPTLYGLLPYV